MSDKCFFDTNILVYIEDEAEEQKRKIARELFTGCVRSGTAVISTQCLQEFYNIASRKLKQDTSTLKRIIHDYAEHLPVVQITPTLIESAIDISVQTQISFWDSLILSAAQSAGCTVLYSEDLNSGQTVNGVTIQNPFAA